MVISSSTFTLFLKLVFPYFMFLGTAPYGSLSYGSKTVRTIIYQIFMGVILAYLFKSHAILAFQIAIILSHIALSYSTIIKNKSLAKVAAHTEKFVLFGVLILILISSMPFKPLIILALVGKRILYYLKTDLLISNIRILSNGSTSIYSFFLIYFLALITSVIYYGI